MPDVNQCIWVMCWGFLNANLHSGDIKGGDEFQLKRRKEGKGGNEL